MTLLVLHLYAALRDLMSYRVLYSAVTKRTRIVLGLVLLPNLWATVILSPGELRVCLDEPPYQLTSVVEILLF